MLFAFRICKSRRQVSVSMNRASETAQPPASRPLFPSFPVLPSPSSSFLLMLLPFYFLLHIYQDAKWDISCHLLFRNSS